MSIYLNLSVLHNDYSAHFVAPNSCFETVLYNYSIRLAENISEKNKNPHGIEQEKILKLNRTTTS